MEKQLFELVHGKGEVLTPAYHIYSIDDDDDGETWYRVDCGDNGSLEIGQLEGHEEYKLERNDWVYVEGKWWMFRCASETYNGYPRITPKEALEILT